MLIFDAVEGSEGHKRLLRWADLRFPAAKAIYEVRSSVSVSQ